MPVNHYLIAPNLPALPEHRMSRINIELFKETLLNGLLIEIVILFVVFDHILKLEIAFALLDLVVLDIADYLVGNTLLFRLVIEIMHHQKVVCIIYLLFLRPSANISRETRHIKSIGLIKIYHVVRNPLVVVFKKLVN